jgi:hypothetical protein
MKADGFVKSLSAVFRSTFIAAADFADTLFSGALCIRRYLPNRRSGHFRVAIRVSL